MKVLFLTNIPSPYRVDFFHELAKYCDLTVLYEIESAADRDAEWGMTDRNNGMYHVVYLKPIVKQTSSAWCPSVKRYLKKGIYDVIIVGVYSTPTGICAIHCLKRRKIPYAINCDGGLVPHTESSWKYKLKKYFLSGAQLYLCSGTYSDAYLLHYGADPQAIRHYPFSSLHEDDILQEPVTEEVKMRLREEFGWRENKIVLSVGSFIQRKGFDVLLEAAAELNDQYGIYIVGGDDTEQYRQFIETRGLEHVHFLPFKKSDELKKYYMSADVFAFPTREDVWGLVINEAMAVGLPVVTTDKCVAGMELVDPEYIVSVGDANGLSSKIERFMENAELRERVGRRNLERIREYTIENMAEVHQSIFKSIFDVKKMNDN